MEKAVFGKEGLELTPRELAKHLRGVNLITQRDLEAAAAALERLAEVEPLLIEAKANLEKSISMSLRTDDRIAELEAALRQWRCPECAHYGNPCLPDQYCHGTGLHPIAAEALKEKT